MRFFINHFKLRSVEVIQFARLLAVLNNGKNIQDFREKLGNEKGLITKNTKQKALDVAALFRELELPLIAEEIETATNQIKSNDL